MPFVVDLFSALTPSADGAPLALVMGSALLGYLIGYRFLPSRIPAVLPAFVAGGLVAAVTGSLGAFPTTFSLPSLEVIPPEFSWAPIATVTPVLLALMTVQANIPSVVYLRSQGFPPPGRAIDVVSGIGTLLGSLLGPVAVSLALPAVLVTAGPAAGEQSLRYRSILLPVATGLVIALFASTAADLAVLLPPVLLLGIAGLALLPALGAALRAIVAGPLVLGPVFAFTIALSDLTLLRLGPFFWSLVLGTLVSLLFEREAWEQLEVDG
jgi:benzoate membrane transport protein